MSLCEWITEFSPALTKTLGKSDNVQRRRSAPNGPASRAYQCPLVAHEPTYLRDPPIAVDDPSRT